MLLEAIGSGLALLILAPVLVLSTEVLAGFFSREDEPAPTSERPRLAILMPAHDEASGIRDTLATVLPQLREGDRLLVVADNCTDDTAAVATAAGGDVIVRTDATRRGKGYALDFGIRYLESDPPAVVLIVDADCRVAEGSVERLARMCAQTQRPVQALYLMRAPPESGVTGRIAEFAAILKNRARPLGLRRLGLPCQLMGTGMAFPWARISSAALASAHIVEDLKLGLELTSARCPPLFCPEAEVTSCFPASREGFKSQRTRWEHGYLGVLVKDAPAVLLQALSTRNGALLALGLDLCVPPIALLTLLGGAAWIAGAVLYAAARIEPPLVITSVAAVLLALCVLVSWARYGRETLSLGTLALAVAYVLWKIPLYGRFLVARQLEWVRTKRDPGGSA